MKASFENDPDRGPGYGLIRLSELDMSNMPQGTPCFSLCRSSDSLYMSVDGWQGTETFLAPDSFRLVDTMLMLAVSPSVVDKLDMQQIYRLTMEGGAKPQYCTLDVQQVCHSPLIRGCAVAEAPSPVTAQPPVPATPAEAVQEAPVAEPSAATTPPADLKRPMPLDMPQLAQKRSSGPWLPLGGAVLCLAIGAGVWWYLDSRQTSPVVQNAPAVPADQKSPMVSAEPDLTAPKQDAPDTPPQSATQKPVAQEPVVQEKAEAPKPPRSAKKQVYEFLRGSGTPAEAVTLGQQLSIITADDQDALFLLMESAAEGGNAEAMLRVARFYSPADGSPSGTIIKDAEQAFNWFSKAKAVPETAHEATGGLTALRGWLQARAANDSTAKALLDRMEN